jgi:transposase InsO family protein
VGAVGAPFDNAMVEAFRARMQVELLNRRRWKTRVELATAIHDYIEIWHNTSKRHSVLNMLTPIEFENQHTTTTIAARFQTPASKKTRPDQWWSQHFW